jgi:C-terminal processing protease CtpA/Prc
VQLIKQFKTTAISIGLVMVAGNATLASAEAAKDNKRPTQDETSDRYRSLETLARGLFYLETMYVDPDKVKEAELVPNALKGIIDHLDPHTMLMPAKAFEQMNIDTHGKFGGVGIIVSQE